MSIEVMKQALEALEEAHPKPYNESVISHVEAITALRAAIAEAEKQEPVACVIDGDLYFHHEIDWEDLAYQGHGVELLYTTPPAAQRQWVGLTDAEIAEWDYEVRDVVMDIEKLLREKNI